MIVIAIILYALLIIGAPASIKAHHSVVRKLSISLTTKGERNSGFRGEWGEMESGGSDSRADLKTKQSNQRSRVKHNFQIDNYQYNLNLPGIKNSIISTILYIAAVSCMMMP